MTEKTDLWRPKDDHWCDDKDHWCLWQKATTPELAKGLADAIQCPNAHNHDIAKEQEWTNGNWTDGVCDWCKGSGRLDGKALEAMREVLAIPDETGSFFSWHDISQLVDAVDAYLEALQEDTDE